MESTFANVYPSLLNLCITGMMATIFISVMKYVTARWPVIPGLRDLFAQI